jgi:tRNA A-37 threonylcarbamoyl transferase component Bud32
MQQSQKNAKSFKGNLKKVRDAAFTTLAAFHELNFIHGDISYFNIIIQSTSTLPSSLPPLAPSSFSVLFIDLGRTKKVDGLSDLESERNKLAYLFDSDDWREFPED